LTNLNLQKNNEQHRTIKDILSIANESGKGDISFNECFLIINHIIPSFEKISLVTNHQQQISSEEYEAIIFLLNQRLAGKPMYQILGYKDFYKDKFYVLKKVLTPRSDTELLVEQSINAIKKHSATKGKSNVIELGTGTGCVILTIAKYSENYINKICGVEIDKAAIKNTNLNMVKVLNGLPISKKLTLVNTCFTKFKNFHYYNIIVSNPPYIPRGKILSLQRSVRQYDSKTSLDGGVLGLDFYTDLLNIASSKMIKKNTRIFLEIGFDISISIKNLIKKHNKSIKLVSFYKDINGINRVVELLKYSN